MDGTGSVRSHRVNTWLGSAEVSLRIAAQIVGAVLADVDPDDDAGGGADAPGGRGPRSKAHTADQIHSRPNSTFLQQPLRATQSDTRLVRFASLAF